MILTKTVIVKWYPANKKHYELKGYIFTKMGDEFEVKVEDLMNGNNKICVGVKCDNPDCENPYLKPIRWQDYVRYVHDNGTYYCRDCARKLYGGENARKTKLANGKSFEQWCFENKKEDILKLWDYELNNCKPSEINYGTTKKYYFKCPNGIHSSELKTISNFTTGNNLINCKQCHSFAQYLYDMYGESALDDYWDYNKNIDKNGNSIDPWHIAKSMNKKVFIFCQKVSYHESYEINCNAFVSGNRCPYCNKNSGKIHPLDSLGTLYPQVLDIWSDKNKKSPYEYSPSSKAKVWWKCPDGEHKDYYRSIDKTNQANFRCPECQNSKGEIKISEYLINNNINYIPQKEFDGLIGLGNGNLSYDFYLTNYNLLIEYQGQFHDGNGNWYMRQNLKQQVEHDRRKREYAKNHNIKLLEIWYYDFNNIEKILDKELKINNSLKEVI